MLRSLFLFYPGIKRLSNLDGAENLSNASLNCQICVLIHRCSRFIDENQTIPPIIMNQTGCGINRQRCSSDHQKVSMLNSVHSFGQCIRIQALLIKHHVRLDRTATCTSWDSSTVQYKLRVIYLMAALTEIAMHRSVQLHYTFTSRLLMQSINILCDDRCQLSCPFQFCQFYVGGIGLCIQLEHFCPVKIEKLFRMRYIKTMT